MTHQTISFIKSGLRLVGYILLFPLVPVAATILVVSEFLGIVEEIGHE